MGLGRNEVRLSKGQLIAFGIFSFLFALSWTLPAYVEGASLFSCVAEAMLLFAPICFLILLAVRALVPAKAALAERGKGAAEEADVEERSFLRRHRVFFGTLAITLVIWGIVFVICFPGITSKDTMDILAMAAGEGSPYNGSFRYDGLNDHHPLLYAALYGIALRVAALFGASMMATVAVLALCHLVCLALSCAYCASTVFTLTKSKGALIFVCLFLTFDPLVALYSVTLWKDVLFAAVVLALACISLRIASLPEEYVDHPVRLIPYGVLLALCALMRSNGIVVAAVMGAGMILLMTGVQRRKVLAWVGACALAFFFLVKGPVSWMLGVQPAHFAEAMGIPLQQIGRAVAEDGSLGEEQRAFIEGIIPLDALEGSYIPSSSNGIKFDEGFDDAFLEAHKAEFLKTWVQVGLDNPGSYLRAWCAQTECYWWVDGSTWYFSSVASDLEGNGLEDGGSLLVPGAKPSHIFAFAQAYLHAFAPLFQPAVLGWFVSFALLCFWARRSRLAALVSLSLTAYWLTFFVAAPATDFRYVFPLMLCVPLVLVLLVVKGAPRYGLSRAGDAAEASGES